MTHFRKCLSLVLVLIMTLSMLPATAAADVTVISSEEALRAMTESGNYQLGGDITLTSDWTPVAGSFSGSLDGDGYTISGLTDALFAEIRGGTVKNLNIVANISKQVDSTITNEQKAAALAFNMIGGSVENVHVSGTVSLTAFRQTIGGLIAFMDSGVVDGCSFNGKILSIDSRETVKPTIIGGLIGMSWFNGDGNPGTITGVVANCKMTGSISANMAEHIYVGGIIGQYTMVGYNEGTFERNFSSAEIDIHAKYVYAGGIAGYTTDQSTIIECAAAGVVVDVDADNEALVGGIVGYSVANASIYKCISTNSSYTASVKLSSGAAYAGGIVGDAYAGGNGRIYFEELLSIGNTLTAGVTGDILGSRNENTQVKNCFFDGVTAIGSSSNLANAPVINVLKKTTAQLRDRSQYDIEGPGSDGSTAKWPDTFDAVWIIPQGKDPTLLWLALNIPSGTLVADAGATGASGNGYQSGSYIGLIGTDVFATLADAVTAASEGSDIVIASNVTDYTFMSGFSVTLNANGGAISSLTVLATGEVTLPAPVRSGHTFNGWLADGTTYQAGDTVSLTAPVTFTAQWTAIPTSGGNTGGNAIPPDAPSQTKDNADGSKTVTTEQTTTAQDGSVINNTNQVTTTSSGAVTETQIKTTTSADGATATTEQTTVIKDASGAVTSTSVTASSTTIDNATGIAATTGTTTTTSGGDSVTKAFAEAKVTPPVSTAGSAATVSLDENIGAALVSALKQSETAAAATGQPMSSAVTISAATGAEIAGASVTLPQSLVSAIANETAASVIINTDAGQIELSNEAINAISTAGVDATSITVSIREADVTELSAEQQSVSEAGKAYVIEITATDSNGNASFIHSLGSGEQVVRLPYKPAPGDDVSNLTVYFADENGVTQKMGGTYNALTGYMEFRSNHNSLYLIVNEASAGFKDIALGSWYYDAVNYMLKAGLMNGMSASDFKPGTALSRAMFVTILYRLDGQPASSDTSKFSDVSSGKWYTAAVTWAAKHGLVIGYNDGTFNPEAAITREEMAVILYRFAIYKGYAVDMSASLTQFKDVGTVSSWAATSVKWAVAEGLVLGVTDTSLQPRGTATRAQIAAVMERFCTKNEAN